MAGDTANGDTGSESAAANYAGVYGGSAGFGAAPALLMVDFAHAYFDPDCPLYAQVDETRAAAIRVRDAARAAGVPVIHTRVLYQCGGRDGGRFFEKAAPLEAFLEGRRTADFAEGLAPGAGEIVITKQYPSAFFGTSLASTLTAMRIDTVLLTGLTTSGCVRASCVDSMSHGFRTIVVAEACGDRHAAPHEANLFDMNAKYADVVGEAAVIEKLGGLGRAA